MKPRTLIAAAVLAAGPLAAQGKGLFDNLVNQPGLGWVLYGSNESAKQVTAPNDVPGAAAVRVTVTAKGANPYDSGAIYASDKPVAQGDTLVMMVYLRAPNVAEGSTIPIPIGIGATDAPYTPVVEQTVQVGPTWKRYFAAGVAPKAFGPGRARIAVQLAGAKQVVELGAAFLMDPGPGFDTAKLPPN